MINRALFSGPTNISAYICLQGHIRSLFDILFNDKATQSIIYCTDQFCVCLRAIGPSWFCFGIV